MKPNTFTKLYAHCVFTPKGRESLMKDQVREKIQKYIFGILEEKNCKPIAINGMADHIHLLFGFIPTISISDLMRDVKRSSALYVNANQIIQYHFSWQEGYGAFTVGYRELDKVFHYIQDQKKHHANQTFKNEFKGILSDEGIKSNEEYLFEFYDPDM